ncbi:MAG: ROK family protein [Thermoguttaceae bacterium]
MQLNADSRIVMTLDAGGTNLRFSAIRGNQVLFEPIHFPSEADDLTRCLANIVEGFTQVRARCPAPPVAISFAFPGPVDYPAGIVGDLGNLPGFRGGVALGPMLEEKFGLPTFLNNDGDLFTYGEAIGGFLPYVNQRLKTAGSAKQFKNLFGITLGTGFGAGIARGGELFIGDNAAAAEIWVSRGKLHNRCFVEEDVGIRAVQRVYAEHSKVKHAETPTPKDIYEFATGSGAGDRQAAILAFETLGEAIGDALANAITLVDGLVVIGGGLSAAAPLFMPRLVAEMNGTIETLDGRQIPRMELKAFNLEDEAAFAAFARGEARRITVPGSTRQLTYDPLKRIGVGLSRLGTSEAVSVGAYAFALHELDRTR